MPTSRILTPVVLALLAVAVLAACGGSAAPGSAGDPSAAQTSTAASPSESASADAGGGSGDAVAIEGFAFQPADLSVSTGTTVTWTNNDAAPHTVQWSDGTPESDRLDQGDTYQRIFDAAGTYDYICGIHPTMTATVTVTE